ncbi:MAG: putative dsRNA-binding protein [Paludibacteraceae bacterium]
MEFFNNKLFPLINHPDQMTEINENPKSQLIEWCQKYHLQFDFILIDETVGANNQHNFLTQLEIEGVTVSRGNGNSKKESQQNASFEALKCIEESSDFLQYIQNQTAF